MTKYCAINLNARYRFSLNIQEMTHTFLVNKCLIFYSICICIHITLKRTVAGWLVTKHLRMVVIAPSSNLLNEHQWSNYLQIIWDYILFHSPIYKYGRNVPKKKWVLLKHWHQEINFVRKKKLNTTLNTPKMQYILPKIKSYSLFIKIRLPGKRSFNSSLCD